MIRKLLKLATVAVLFMGVQAGSASANLVQNGSFQTGNFTDWSFSNLSNTFAIVAPVAPQNIVPGGPTGNEAQLGTNGLGTDTQIFQSIATSAGHSYTVSFWLANDDISATSGFQALGNGSAETLTQLTFNAPKPNGQYSHDFAYNEFEFTVLATGSTTNIAFDFQNDNSIYHLTDLDANVVPEPSAILLLGLGLASIAVLKFRSNTAA